jgi:uncharacterized protein (TIGR03067 family)
MRGKIVLVVLLGFLGAASTRGGDVKKELEKFSGAWQAVAITNDGKEVSGKDLKATILLVKGSTYTLRTPKGLIKGKHKLDPTKKPKTIDAERTAGSGKGEKLHGIYELSDDTFKVCFAAPGMARPKEFAAPAGSGNRLVVMERLRKKR